MRQPRPFNPGINFKDTKLYIFSESEVCVIKGWPDLMAWQKNIVGGWRCVYPTLNTEALRRSISGQRKREKTGYQFFLPFPDADFERPWRMQVWNKFYNTIPLDVRRIMARFRTGHWNHLQFLARCPGAMDLYESNNALAFALAHNRFFRKPAVARPWRSARALLRHNQRHILKWLGFLATESVRKILRKIVPRSLTVGRLIYPREALANPLVRDILSHCDRINAGVLRIVSDGRLRAYISSGLIMEIGDQKNNDTYPHLAYILSDTIELMYRLNGSCTIFRSVEQLKKAYSRLIVRACGPKNIQFSPQPAPIHGSSDIIPLTTPDEIAREGFEQRNCLKWESIVDYLEGIVKGYIYLYRGLSPQRFTLSVEKHGGIWVRREIRGPGNREVKSETIAKVDEWLFMTQQDPIKKDVELLMHA